MPQGIPILRHPGWLVPAGPCCWSRRTGPGLGSLRASEVTAFGRSTGLSRFLFPRTTIHIGGPNRSRERRRHQGKGSETKCESEEDAEVRVRRSRGRLFFHKRRDRRFYLRLKPSRIVALRGAILSNGSDENRLVLGGSLRPVETFLAVKCFLHLIPFNYGSSRSRAS